MQRLQGKYFSKITLLCFCLNVKLPLNYLICDKHYTNIYIKLALGNDITIFSIAVEICK